MLKTSATNESDVVEEIIQEEMKKESVDYPFLSLTSVEAEQLETCYEDLLEKYRQLRVEVDIVEAQLCIVRDELVSRPGYGFYG